MATGQGVGEVEGEGGVGEAAVKRDGTLTFLKSSVRSIVATSSRLIICLARSLH